MEEEEHDATSVIQTYRLRPVQDTGRSPYRLRRGSLISLLAAAIGGAAAASCARPPAALTQLIEARRLAAELHVQFAQAADAANRAVMSEADDASTAAAEEARRARQIVERDIPALQTILQSLDYRDDLRHLESFASEFDEYRRIDDEILPLAAENTNVKAQRLSFGPLRDAADAFRTALAAAVHTAAAGDRCCVQAAAARAQTGLLEIQVLHAPHIAEADDAAMTRMEVQMTASAAAARNALDELRAALPAAAAPHLAAASDAVDRFMSIHAEIVTLSRRNSDVRTLALSLGRKRIVTAACEAQLQALEEALAKHEFTATR